MNCKGDTFHSWGVGMNRWQKPFVFSEMSAIAWRESTDALVIFSLCIIAYFVVTDLGGLSILDG